MIEPRRLCGFRKIEGYYLVGGMAFMGCDRLPIELMVCPVCGAGIRFSRGIGGVNPLKLWGPHDKAHFVKDVGILTCICPKGCNVCYPPNEPAFIMFVGEKYYTVQEFITEARSMGVSKRLPGPPPEGLIPGKTVVYLAHKKCIDTGKKDEKGKTIFKQGVFAAFVPQRVERLCWQSDYTKENIAKYEKKGIKLIPVPMGDPDHKPSRKRDQPSFL